MGLLARDVHHKLRCLHIVVFISYILKCFLQLHYKLFLAICLFYFVHFNSFVPSAPFLYSLKTPENLTIFLHFQGVEKGYSGNE